MAILAQSYVHVDAGAELWQLHQAREQLEYLAAKHVYIRFPDSVRVEVAVAEGSLKGWVTVLGALYFGIAGYGSFRSGIDHIIKDARWFSANVIEDFNEYRGLDRDSVIRTERRLGTPGRIKRLIPRIETATRLLNEGSDDAAAPVLQQISNGIAKVRGELEDEVDPFTEMSLVPPEVLMRLPRPAPTPPRLPRSQLLGYSARDEEILSEQVDRKHLVAVLATNSPDALFAPPGEQKRRP